MRSHWSIENQLHWVLDVSFNEDASRVRANHGPENLSVARRMALNILRQDTSSKSSVKSRLYKAALDSEYFKKMLEGVF